MVGKFTETLIADDKRAGSKCMVGAALRGDKLDDEDRANLAAWLDPDSGVPYTKITRGIKAAGYTIGNSAVSKHVAGQCSCG
jgi:hypothetical protein